MIWAAPALAGDYERALREATREKAIYRDAHPAMMIDAVWLDEALAATQARKLAEMGGTPPTADPALVLVFGAYSHWRDELAFSADGSTPWVLRAWRGETACTLLEVKEVEADAWSYALYPFLSRWDRLFTARFDAGCGAGAPRLELVGPRGRLAVDWAR